MSRALLRPEIGLDARIVLAAFLLVAGGMGCSLVSLDNLAAGAGSTGVAGTDASSASTGPTSGPGSASSASTGSSTTTGGGDGGGGGVGGPGGGGAGTTGGGEGGTGVTVGPGGGGAGGSLVVGDCQSTPVIDRFDRPDGPLGDTWVNVEGIVIDDQRAENEPKPAGYKHAEWYQTFGPDQEAHVTLTDISASGQEQLLLLKIVGASNIEVLYSPADEELQVWTCTPSCTPQETFPYEVSEGSRLAARASRDGVVSVCVDGAFIFDADVTDWGGWEGGGAIGIGTLHYGAGDPPFAFEDFGGGDVSE